MELKEKEKPTTKKDIGINSKNKGLVHNLIIDGEIIKDNLEHIKRMPLFKIDPNLFDNILDYDFKVDEEFLNKINNLGEKYTNTSVEKISYSSIFTDGVRAIAIEFSEEGESVYRSRLLLDEEQDVIIISNKLLEYKLNIIRGRKRINQKFITRLESDIKKLLTIEIKNSYKNGNFDKLKYLYFEFFGKEQDNIDIAYKKLIESIDKEINYNHNKLYEVIKLSYQNKS